MYPPITSRTVKPEAAAAASPDPERLGKAGVPIARAARIHFPFLQPSKGPGAKQPAGRDPAPSGEGSGLGTFRSSSKAQDWIFSTSV